MFEDLPERLTARFGQAGLRRFDLRGGVLPAEEAALLTGCGVPRQVGPYFTSSQDDSARFGAFRAPDPDDAKAGWCRIGWDRGAQLCVDGTGTVRAEFPGTDPDESGAVVNTSLGGFLESLLVLDEALSVIAAAGGVPEGAAQLRTLLKQLAGVDSAVMDAPESWWSRVLQDVRHTMMHSSYAAFEIVDADGRKQIVSEPGGLCLHPEERLWHSLRVTGLPAERVRRVYTELEPCLMPGHYCSLWMAEEFPDAEFTHSFDYGEDTEAREAGFLELLRHSAAQQ